MRRRQAFAKAAMQERDRAAMEAMDVLGDALTSYAPDNHPVAIVHAGSIDVRPYPEGFVGSSAPGSVERLHEVARDMWAAVGSTKPLSVKGHCPKCKRYIGRGVGMHARKCRGAEA